MKRYTECVAVTGLNSGDNLAPGSPVIRSLKEEPAFQGRIVGLSYDALEAGIYMEGLAQDVYLLPYPYEGMEAIRTRMAAIHADQKIDVLIPNLDSEILSFIRLEPFLKGMGIHMFLPTEEQFLARAKMNLPNLGVRCSLRVPKSRIVFDRVDAAYGIFGVPFPIMIKGFLCEAYMAYTGAQAAGYFDLLAAKWGVPVILQEVVTGVEFDLAALGDGLGGTIGAVAMRKEALSDKGKAWGGVTIYDVGLLRLAHRFIETTRWKGPLEIEVIQADRDHAWYLIEVNPRFPAWIYLAAAAGQNLPFAAIQLALGERVTPMTHYKAGVRFIRYAQDLICRPTDFEALLTTGEKRCGEKMERTLYEVSERKQKRTL